MGGSASVCVADTETTGFHVAEGAVLLEFACLDPYRGGYSTFVEFDGVIPPEARAVHHISPEDVRPGVALTREAVGGIIEMIDGEVDFWAFHNAPFDLQFLPEITKPVIDTLQCARHLFPESPNHKNQTLRYFLDAEPEARLIEGLFPHRALYDVAVTRAILDRMLTMKSAEDLEMLTRTPILLRTCNFGKHKGKSWEEVARTDRSYFSWMLDKSDMCANDANLEFTARHYLGRSR